MLRCQAKLIGLVGSYKTTVIYRDTGCSNMYLPFLCYLLFSFELAYGLFNRTDEVHSFPYDAEAEVTDTVAVKQVN